MKILANQIILIKKTKHNLKLLIMFTIILIANLLYCSTGLLHYNDTILAYLYRGAIPHIVSPFHDIPIYSATIKDSIQARTRIDAKLLLIGAVYFIE